MCNNEYQIELKTAWIDETKGKYTVQCKCGLFAGHCKERDSVILYCDTCGYETEIKFLSYKNVNNTKNFRAVWHNKESVDNVNAFEQKFDMIHSSKCKPKFSNAELAKQALVEMKIQNDKRLI
jgi:hypothetical protein